MNRGEVDDDVVTVCQEKTRIVHTNDKITETWLYRSAYLEIWHKRHDYWLPVNKKILDHQRTIRRGSFFKIKYTFLVSKFFIWWKSVSDWRVIATNSKPQSPSDIFVQTYHSLKICLKKHVIHNNVSSFMDILFFKTNSLYLNTTKQLILENFEILKNSLTNTVLGFPSVLPVSIIIIIRVRGSNYF